MDDTLGSPVEMAKSYMKVRPPWASPSVDNSGLRTPSQMKAKLFDEEAPYSVSSDSLSLKVLKMSILLLLQPVHFHFDPLRGCTLLFCRTVL